MKRNFNFIDYAIRSFGDSVNDYTDNHSNGQIVFHMTIAVICIPILTILMINLL